MYVLYTAYKFIKTLFDEQTEMKCAFLWLEH